MNSLKISDPLALQLLMNEDLYYVKTDDLQVNTISTTEDKEISESLPPTDETAFFEYLGENNKYLLILVNDPSHKVIAPNHLETLVNILKGKKQEIKDVAIVNLHNYPEATFTALKSFFACSSIIMFGINPGLLKVDGASLNQISMFSNTKILATYSISEMLNSVDKKRMFWDEMKKL